MATALFALMVTALFFFSLPWPIAGDWGTGQPQELDMLDKIVNKFSPDIVSACTRQKL